MLNEGEDALIVGETARHEKRLREAAQAFARATEYFRAVGDEPRLVHALSREAQIARDTKDLKQARRLQEASVNLARQAALSSPLPHLIRHLADILQEDGDPSAAAPLYEEMMTLYHASGDASPLELANATRSIACNSQALGDTAAAIRHWRSAREQYQALGDVFRDAYGLAENPGVLEADRRLADLGLA